MPILDNATMHSLMTCSKRVARFSNKECGADDRYQRQDIELLSSDGKERFHVFIRKSLELADDFSIGLQHVALTDSERTVLLRCNGRHCPPDNIDGAKLHHSEFHIHTGKAENIAIGMKAEAGAEITRFYASFDGALAYFIRTCNIMGAERYFPTLPSGLPSGQGDLFEDGDAS